MDKIMIVTISILSILVLGCFAYTMGQIRKIKKQLQADAAKKKPSIKLVKKLQTDKNVKEQINQKSASPFSPTEFIRPLASPKIIQLEKKLYKIDKCIEQTFEDSNFKEARKERIKLREKYNIVWKEIIEEIHRDHRDNLSA